MKVIQYLLQHSDEVIDSLLTKVANSDKGLIIERWVHRWGRQDVWNCIESALSTSKKLDSLPILHKVIEHTPKHCSEVINRFPNSVHVRDPNNYNRLPIHVALTTGMKFSIELTCIINSSQEHLNEVDPVTKWPPFVLAAMGTSCDLITIYRMLQSHPDHVEMWCDGIVTNKEYITVDTCKRRKMN